MDDDVPTDEETTVPHLLVGRERELRRLLRLLHPSRTGQRAAVVQGEAGIGKTQLLVAFLKEARASGFQVLEGHCHPAEEAGPYLPFLQVFEQLQGSRPPALDSAFEESGAPRHVDQLAHDAAARRSRFTRLLGRAVMEEASRRKTLLAIEDIQWADVESLLVINDLLDLSQQQLLLVFTLRHEERLPAGRQQLLARIEGRTQLLRLKGLDRKATRSLVEGLAGVGCLTKHEVEGLQSLTNGNPLMLGELVRNLVETGLLSRRKLLAAVEACGVPDRLSFTIDLRLRTQSRPVLRVLEASAVVGAEFGPQLVAAITGMAEDVTADALHTAARSGIVREVHNLGHPRYCFSHELFRARLYESLPPSRRRRLHGRIVGAASSPQFDIGIEELARHSALGMGANRRDAALRCEAAAERAERLFAYETAARFWELAVKCSGDLSRAQRARLWSKLGWSLWATREWVGAAEAWRETIRVLELLDDRPGMARHALALAELHRWSNELDEAERWAERALNLGLGDAADHAQALGILGHIRCSHDRPDLGVPLLESARSASSTNGRADPMISYWLSYGYLVSGDPERAYSAAQDGLQRAVGQSHARAVALLAGSLIQHELCRLRPGEAKRHSKLLDGAVLPADAPGLNRRYLCQALILAYEGKWRQVISLCNRWMADMRLVGRFQVAVGRLVRAEAKLALGDAATAQEEMARVLPDMSEMRPLGALHLARALVRLGRHEEAASVLAEHVPRITAGRRHSSARALLGDVAASLGDRKLCECCYETLGREARPVLVVYSPISVQRVLGKLAMALKDWSTAGAHFETAVRQLTAGQAEWELAQTYLDFAAMWRARNRRGDTTRAVSLEIEADKILRGLSIFRDVGPAQAPPGNRFGLTSRELEVLGVLAEGCSNPEIAEALTITRGTVERHLERIFTKMAVSGRTEAVVRAIEEGLVGPMAAPSDKDGRQTDPDAHAVAV